MTEDAVAVVFAKAPFAWEPEEAELVKRVFRERRPAVPRQVVAPLWRYWRQRCPGQPLFDDPEDDLALLLHARALGVEVPAPDPGEPLAALLDRAEDPGECGPVVPERLPWGPRAALSTDVRAALPGTLVRAWVVADDQGPVEVLVVGEGLPEIRRQVVQSALTTSLRVNGMADGEPGVVGDFVGVGLIRISAGLAGKQTAMDLPSVFDARHVTTAEGAAPTARGALREFVNHLRALERETNLVELAEVAHADSVAFAEEVRALADRAAAQPHRAFLRPALPGADGGGPVALLPCLRTAEPDDARPGSGIGVALHPDLLETAAYRALEEAHQRVLAQRLAMDAKLRRDRLEADIRWLRTELEAYLRADEAERRSMWDPTVLLVERFDERVGTVIRLAEPEEIDSDTYYRNNVPQLIALREDWARRLNELVANLETAVARPYAPARQLAAGRFLDAVLRDVVPDESPATEDAFRRWSDQVAPLLRFEWRHALRRQRIDPADVLTRHTAFVTRYLPAIDGDDAELHVHLYSVVDDRLSAVLADAARGALVVRDATDHAEPEPAGEPDAVAADQAWQTLVRLADDGDEKAFDAAFLAALRAHPRHVAHRVAEELHPPEPGAAEAETIDAELESARRALSLSEGMHRALVAMRLSAFATARQCLDAVHAEPRWEARAWLLRAVVECVAAEVPYREIPDLLGAHLPGVPSAASRAVDEAADLDAAYTTAWLAALPDTDLDKAVRRLFHGIPRARTCTTERERAVWLFRGAVESARLARQLEQAGEELSEEAEAIDSALVKVGKAVEDIVLGQFVSGGRDEAQALFEVLTGEEQPRYGRVTGA